MAYGLSASKIAAAAIYFNDKFPDVRAIEVETHDVDVAARDICFHLKDNQCATLSLDLFRGHTRYMLADLNPATRYIIFTVEDYFDDINLFRDLRNGEFGKMVAIFVHKPQTIPPVMSFCMVSFEYDPEPQALAA